MSSQPSFYLLKEFLFIDSLIAVVVDAGGVTLEYLPLI
jgi:hypothetical protein